MPFGNRNKNAGIQADGAGLLELGDFTANNRVILLAIIAVGIGVLSAFVALALLRLIGLFTNLFFFQRWGTTLVSPVGNKLGAFEIVVPALGALIVTALNDGLILLNVNPYAQEAVNGLVLVAAVALTIDRRKLGFIK